MTSNLNKDTIKPVTQPTEADQIWEEIRKLPINLFGLANQTLEQHVKRINVTPQEVHLQLRVSAVASALEDAVTYDVRGTRLPKPLFELEQAIGYLVVRRAAPTPTVASTSQRNFFVNKN